jgi:hypothetical protein
MCGVNHFLYHADSFIGNMLMGTTRIQEGITPVSRMTKRAHGEKNPDMGITEDQVKIVENSMIPTTRALNVEEGKIGDIGKTAGPLDILYDPADIFLYLL